MFRPELDHVSPVGELPMVIAVLDRQENRRKASTQEAEKRDRAWMQSRSSAPPRRPRKRERTGGARIGKVTKARALDQFYTLAPIAAGYIEFLRQRYHLPSYLMVEPSAGGGAFYQPMPENSVAFDIDPQAPGILKADYLAIDLRCARPILTVGNPPFGNVACVAVDFFNHAARESQVIAMILPRSVLKASIENRLHSAFHLVHCEDVPPYAFELAGEPRNVAAVFQVWERGAVPRDLRPQETTHADFEFTDQDSADFAIRRVGGYAGRITPGRELRERRLHADSYHFIKGDVEHVMAQLDLVGAASNATSTPSLARSEIVEMYRERVEGRAKPAPGDQASPSKPGQRVRRLSVPGRSMAPSKGPARRRMAKP